MAESQVTMKLVFLGVNGRGRGQYGVSREFGDVVQARGWPPWREAYQTAMPVPLQTVFASLVGPELHSCVGEFGVTIPEVFIVQTLTETLAKHQTKLV